MQKYLDETDARDVMSAPDFIVTFISLVRWMNDHLLV